MASFYDGTGKKISIDDVQKVEHFGLPSIYITCPDADDTMAVLASGTHDITIKYVDTEKIFECYGTAKKQGAFTSTGNKKNLNVTLYTDSTKTTKQKVKFEPWYKTHKYHIKGNRSDYSMVRNSVLTRIAYQFCGGLSLPEGAMGYIDSFPVILYWNGNWFGCYTVNLPQDERIFNFKDGNENHMAWRVDDTSNWANAAGWEFRGDSDNLTANMTANFQTLLDLMNQTTITKAEVENSFDVNSLLSYIVFMQIGYLNDSTLNNWTLATWDGTKWYHIFYDLDIGFGFSNAGDIPASAHLTMNAFHTKVEALFPDEIKAVYANMRNAGLTAQYVADKLYEFQGRWGWQNLQKEYQKWEDDKPFKKGLDTVLPWLTARLTYLDGVYEYTE